MIERIRFLQMMINLTDEQSVIDDDMNKLILSIQQFIVEHFGEMFFLDKEDAEIYHDGISALKDRCSGELNCSHHDLRVLFKTCVNGEKMDLMGYAKVLDACLSANVPLAFNEGQCGNPWLTLLEAKRGDLIEKLAQSPYFPKDLFDSCVEEVIERNDLEGARLLGQVKAQLEESVTFRQIQGYFSKYAFFCWIVQQLQSEISQIHDRDLLNFLHYSLYEDVLNQKFDFLIEFYTDILNLPPPNIQFFKSALEYANKMQKIDVCKFFIELIGQDHDNNPLHQVILNKDKEEIHEISNSSKFYFCLKNARQQTPFDLLVESNGLDLLPSIALYCDFQSNKVIGSEYMGNFTNHPILAALRNHHFEMAKALWDLGYEEEFRLIQNLLNEDPEVKPHLLFFSQPPEIIRLMEACQEDNLAVVKEILHTKPWLINVTYKKYTPLGIAVIEDAHEVVAFLHSQKGSVYGILNICPWDEFSVNVPLYAALIREAKEAVNLFLEALPNFPSFDELLKVDDIPQDIKQNYLFFTKVVDKLIEEKNLDRILFLAAHPKTKELVLREGLVRMVEGNWCDAKTIRTMLESGFELNGICKLGDGQIRTALTNAIFQNNIELTQLFLDQGAIFEPSLPTPHTMATPFLAARQACNRESNMEMVLLLLDVHQQKHLVLPWDILIDFVPRFPGDRRLLCFILQARSGLTRDVNQVIAQNLSDLIFDPDLNISQSMAGLFNYGITYCKTLDEWNHMIKEAKECAKALNLKFSKSSSLNQAETETSKLMNQIYYHILCGMNSQLNEDSKAVSKIVSLLLNSAIELHDKVLIALQAGSSIEDIESGIKYAGLLQSGSQIPSPAFFGKSLLEDVLKDLEGWLNYFFVFRSRKGLILCNRVLKYQKDSPRLLLKALKALERIGIKHWSKAIENTQIQNVIEILQTCRDLQIKKQACKTLWILSNDGNDESLKLLFSQELEALNLDDPHSKNYALTLIELLGNYIYSDSKVGERTARLLRQLLQHNDSDIVCQTVLAISKTNDPLGLSECLKVIERPTWQLYRDDEGKDAIHQSGSFLMFRQRPAAIHDNKHAIRLRILDRLAMLESGSLEFTQQIEERFKAYKANPNSNLELKLFEEHFLAIPRMHTRYVGMPLYLPSGSAIGRGLSSRKGEELFFESIRDLIRKGCGSTDLTLETSEVEGQAWGRIGHIFGSHKSELFFDHEGIYFNGSNSAFLVISADYYNSEFMCGEARMESETSFNNIWYRGVPKKELQAIFLEKQNRHDIELLAGHEPIVSIQHTLTSNIFKGQSVKELVQLRRHLQAKDWMIVKGEKVQLSLAERIRYYDSTQKPPLPIEDVQAVGFIFPSEEQLLEESLKRAIGRQLIQEKLR